jgi:hypothetical protein
MYKVSKMLAGYVMAGQSSKVSKRSYPANISYADPLIPSRKRNIGTLITETRYANI